jgi:hypothetical protein
MSDMNKMPIPELVTAIRKQIKKLDDDNTPMPMVTMIVINVLLSRMTEVYDAHHQFMHIANKVAKLRQDLESPSLDLEYCPHGALWGKCLVCGTTPNDDSEA